MTSKVGTASALGEIRHTQDLIAAIAEGKVKPGSIPPELDKPSIRTLVAAILRDPHKPRREPYTTKPVAYGVIARFTLMNANSGIAPPVGELPGPKSIQSWMNRGKLHAESCKDCGAPTAVIEVRVGGIGGKIGYISVEDGKVVLSPEGHLTEADFLSPQKKRDLYSLGPAKRR